MMITTQVPCLPKIGMVWLKPDRIHGTVTLLDYNLPTYLIPSFQLLYIRETDEIGSIPLVGHLGWLQW